MDFVQPAHRGRRIGLLRAPLTQHRRPNTGGTNGIHANAVLGIVQRHGPGERVQAALGRSVGGVEFLADDADQAGSVEDAALAGDERVERVAGCVEHAFQIHGAQLIPFLIGCLMKGFGGGGYACIVMHRVQPAKML